MILHVIILLSPMHHFVLSDFGNVSLSYIISLHCNIHNWNIFQSYEFFLLTHFCPTLHINIMASYRKLLFGVRNIVQTSQTRFSFQKLYGSAYRNFATTSLKNFPICTGIFKLESFVTVTVNQWLIFIDSSYSELLCTLWINFEPQTIVTAWYHDALLIFSNACTYLCDTIELDYNRLMS